MRRFLLHVLPEGFQRIRYYGFLANGNRQAKLARVRQLLPAAAQEALAPATQGADTARIAPDGDAGPPPTDELQTTCLECGGEMEIVETLAKTLRRGAPRIDTS
jgi:Putative transposase